MASETGLPPAQPPLEIDDEAYDSGSNNPSTHSTSLSSSVIDYVYENGRRYNSYRKGTYLLPNDEAEQERLDLYHHIFLLLLNGALTTAPIKNPRRVLDVGTGTGIWAIDFADTNPACEVIGTDLSPIQPTWVPPNVHFYVDDAEADWTYTPSEAFDYVHVRTLTGSIGDWDKFLGQAYTHLNPGGWIELQEGHSTAGSVDGSLERAEHVLRWQKLINDASKLFQKDMGVCPSLKGRLEKAGFVEVKETVIDVPVGPWAKDKKFKEIGRYQLENFSMVMEAYAFTLLGNMLNYTQDECRDFAADVMKEFRDPRSHITTPMYFVSGKKPEK